MSNALKQVPLKFAILSCEQIVCFSILYLVCTTLQLTVHAWHWQLAIHNIPLQRRHINVLEFQINGISTVCLMNCSGLRQRKHQTLPYWPSSSVRGKPWWLVVSPHKGPEMTYSCLPWIKWTSQKHYYITEMIGVKSLYTFLKRPPCGRFKNVYELLNLGALKIWMLYKSHIFQCMGKIFCAEF